MIAIDTNVVLRLLVNDDARQGAAALRRVLGLPNVRVEDPGAVAAALDATGRGLELADALHLLRAPEDAESATFDRGLARSGRRLRPVRLV